MTRHLALCLAALLAAPWAPARALTFNFTTATGDTLTAGQSAAFQAAASIWSSFLTDDITVNLSVGFTNLASGVLGATSSTLLLLPGIGAKALLAADATSSADATAVVSFSTSNQNFLVITSAEAKAIGAGIPAEVVSDGKIEFSTSFTFSETRNANGGIAAGTYDLIGIAEHEIGHLLGFVSGVDPGFSGYQTVLDQFRYGSLGMRSFASGAAAYFSINGGATNSANFSTGVGNQASHWAIGTSGVMVPEVAAGNVQNITALDVLAMDVIGYDVAVPEPASLAVLAIGVLGAAATRRQRGRLPAG